jgi:hypothetical protein
METREQTKRLRVLVVDENTRRRQAFARVFGETGWEVRCVRPEGAHAASQALEPHATLVAYPRAKPAKSVGALLRTRGGLTLLPPDTVGASVTAPDGSATASLVELVRAAAAA